LSFNLVITKLITSKETTFCLFRRKQAKNSED